MIISTMGGVKKTRREDSKKIDGGIILRFKLEIMP
jgi:hypothetical protein